MKKIPLPIIILGILLVIIIPLITLLVSMASGSYKLFFYGLSGAFAGIGTWLLMKRFDNY
jgi:hypothetical protein